MNIHKVQSIHRNLFKVADSARLDNGVVIPCIVGQAGQVDVVSQNGYRYKRGFWDKVLGDSLIQDAIKNRDILGMIEHPTDDDEYLKTPYDKASHVIMKAWVQDGNPFATFGLLNNERGNQIKALIDVGHRPGVSTRGLGNYDRDNISQFVTDEGYVFLGWDLVRNPNFGDLKMDKVTDSLMKSPIFRELCEMHHLKDSADDHYNHDNLIRNIDDAIDALNRLKSSL